MTYRRKKKDKKKQLQKNIRGETQGGRTPPWRIKDFHSETLALMERPRLLVCVVQLKIREAKTRRFKQSIYANWTFASLQYRKNRKEKNV